MHISVLILECFADCVGTVKSGTVTCCSSNGREPEMGDGGVKKLERLLEEKRRAELSARIASGEFTVKSSGYV